MVWTEGVVVLFHLGMAGRIVVFEVGGGIGYDGDDFKKIAWRGGLYFFRRVLGGAGAGEMGHQNILVDIGFILLSLLS